MPLQPQRYVLCAMISPRCIDKPSHSRSLSLSLRPKSLSAYFPTLNLTARLRTLLLLQSTLIASAQRTFPFVLPRVQRSPWSMSPCPQRMPYPRWSKRKCQRNQHPYWLKRSKRRRKPPLHQLRLMRPLLHPSPHLHPQPSQNLLLFPL